MSPDEYSIGSDTRCFTTSDNFRWRSSSHFRMFSWISTGGCRPNNVINLRFFPRTPLLALRIRAVILISLRPTGNVVVISIAYSSIAAPSHIYRYNEPRSWFLSSLATSSRSIIIFVMSVSSNCKHAMAFCMYSILTSVIMLHNSFSTRASYFIPGLTPRTQRQTFSTCSKVIVLLKSTVNASDNVVSFEASTGYGECGGIRMGTGDCLCASFT